MSTLNSSTTNENASGGAEASKPKHCVVNIVDKLDRRNEFKRALNASIAPDAGGESVVMPAETAANDLMPHHNPFALPVQVVAPVAPPEMRYKLRTGADVCNSPHMPHMVQGVLPAEGLAVLFGASGSGKSFMALDLGCAVAGGEAAWFGRRITQAPVTYICLEGEAGMGKRVKAWSLHHGKPVPDSLRDRKSVV